jgi:CTP:molybdopterin cytidylyltransferase MocA
MGQPKLLLPWRGTTVIGHLLAQWRELGVAQIGIVCRPNDNELVEELKRNAPDTLQLFKVSTHLIPNPQPERGMFSSILCAANWSGWGEEVTRWAIVLGDQPHLRSDSLRQLLDFSAQNPVAICQPEFGGRTGHPVILPRTAFEQLKISGATNLKEFLKLSASSRVLCSVADPGLSLDMDTPEDYKRLTAFP